MGEWTWLHVLFPLADMELISDPIDAKAANVIVRTIRALKTDETAGDKRFEVRVAPHNVAPFRGGPWLREFSKAELQTPGESLYAFRAQLAAEIEAARALGR